MTIKIFSRLNYSMEWLKKHCITVTINSTNWVLQILIIVGIFSPTIAEPVYKWLKTYGGMPEAQMVFHSTQSTNDDGFITAGNTIPILEAIQLHDGFLAKIDSKGDTLWTKIFGSIEEDDYLYSAIQKEDSGYITVGKTGIFN